MRYFLLFAALLLVFGCVDKDVTSRDDSSVTKTQFGETVSAIDSWHWKVNLTQETSTTAEVPPDPEAFIEVDSEPKFKEQVDPIYPVEAREAGIQGKLWVRVLINKNGRVSEAIISEPSGLNVGFEKSALQAAVNTTWEPAMKNGTPIQLWVNYQIQFKLSTGESKKETPSET